MDCIPIPSVLIPRPAVAVKCADTDFPPPLSSLQGVSACRSLVTDGKTSSSHFFFEGLSVTLPSQKVIEWFVSIDLSHKGNMC